MELSGKTAFVTGGSGDIGGAIARGQCAHFWAFRVENPPLRGLYAPSGRDARLAEQALARSKLSSQVSADLHQLRREWETMLAPN